MPAVRVRQAIIWQLREAEASYDVWHASPATRRFLNALLAGAVALCFGSAGVSGPAPAAAAPGDAVTAIVGATVIHPEFEGPAAVGADSTILIAGNRIKAVGRSASIPVPRSARI